MKPMALLVAFLSFFAFTARLQAQVNLTANGVFDANLSGWSGVKVGSLGQVAAPELISRVTTGTWQGSPGSLRVKLTKQLGFAYQSHAAGAVATLASSVPAGTTLRVELSARVSSGTQTILNIGRLGGGGAESVQIGATWRRYTLYLGLDQATNSLLFNVLPKQSEAVQTLQNFQVDLDDVRISGVESGHANLVSNGRFESSIAPWAGQKDSTSGPVAAAELISRVTNDAAAGTGALRLSVVKDAAYTYPSHLSGAVIPFSKPVKAGSVLQVRFAAKSLSGPAWVNVSRVWGGSQAAIAITNQWASYEARLTVRYDTANLVFGIVPGYLDNLQTLADGQVLLDEVDIRVVGAPQDGLVYDYRADKCQIPVSAAGAPTVCPDVRPFNPQRMYLAAGPLPSLQATSSGGYPALVATAGATLRSSGLSTLIPQYSFAYVVRKNSSATSDLFWSEETVGTGVKVRIRSDYYSFQIFGPGVNDLLDMGATERRAPQLQPDVGQFFVVRGGPSGAEIWVDGILHAKTTKAVWPVDLENILLKVADGDRIELSEVLAYDRSLSDPELNQLHAYLGARYEIEGGRPYSWFSADALHEVREHGSSETSGYDFGAPGATVFDAALGHVVASSSMSSQFQSTALVPFGSGHWAMPFPSDGSAWLRLPSAVFTRDYGRGADYVKAKSFGEYTFTMVAQVPIDGGLRNLFYTMIPGATEWSSTFSDWMTLRLDESNGRLDFGNEEDEETFRGTNECVVPRGKPFIISLRGSTQTGRASLFVNGQKIYDDGLGVTPVDAWLWFGDPFIGSLAEFTTYLRAFEDDELSAYHQALQAKYGIVPVSSCDARCDPECNGCGDGFLEEEEDCEPSLATQCSASCEITDRPTRCEVDDDCPDGQSCGLENGLRFGGYPYESFCWPTSLCPAACGEGSPCGACECEPSCAQAQCGQRTPDGCGDYCTATCATGEAGCLDNRDCQPGSVCTPQGTTSVCLAPRGYEVLADGYFTPQTRPDGTQCLEGALCPVQDCEQACKGVCNVRGECLASADEAVTCPASCPRACDAQGRCYASGALPTPVITEADPAPASGVGETKGVFEVGQDGVARYTLPIEVAPGRAGLIPDLALSYSSVGGDGPLGLGWSLAGVSAITVCDSSAAANYFEMSYNGPRVCLDGQPLYPLFAESGQVRQSVVHPLFLYRTRTDNGLLVTGSVRSWGIESTVSLAPRLVPGDAFQVFTEDGRILTFGGSEPYLLRGARDPLMGPSDIRKWLLARVQDRFGNVINFEYQKGAQSLSGQGFYNPSNGGFERNINGRDPVIIKGLDAEAVLRRISYNTDIYGIAASSEVLFRYNEDKLHFDDAEPDCTPSGYCTHRPAVHYKYWRGGPLADLLMLDRIEVHTLGRLVRTYDLGHQTTADGRVTLLNWIQECDYNHQGTQCLGPVDFDYGDAKVDDVREMGGASVRPQDSSEGMLSHSRSFQSNQEMERYKDAYTAIADFNGDGADDYASFQIDGALWVAFGDDAAGLKKLGRSVDFPSFFKFKKTEGKEEHFELPFGMVASDWNKDGLADVVIWGLDQDQHTDGEQVVSRCDSSSGGGRRSYLCGANRDAGRLRTDVPLAVWVYKARIADGALTFDIEKILTERTMNGVPGLASFAGMSGPVGVDLNSTVRHNGVSWNASILPYDYNNDGLLDFLYCTNGGDKRGALAITTGSHLGERLSDSFDPSVRASVAGQPTFIGHALTGLAASFCREAMVLQTRSDRTDVWSPKTRQVLAEFSTPRVFNEVTFGSLKLSDYDVKIAEVNGDDLPDLVLHKRSDKTGQLEWWFNTGSGFYPDQGIGFVPGQSATPRCEFKHLAQAVVADFNNDGLDDVVLPMCGESSPNRVIGLGVAYARRSATGAPEYQPIVGLDSVVPSSSCENAESWAPDKSPYRAFLGDFDGDGDQDLRVTGEEWDNGTPSDSNQYCWRIPKERKCCVEEKDENGYTLGFKCYKNGADNRSGECEPPGHSFAAPDWKHFVTEVANRTFETADNAWYLLGRISSSPVAGRTGTEIDIRYGTGAGIQAWEASATGCAELPKLTNTRDFSQPEDVRTAPQATDVSDRRIYQRTTTGTGCNLSGLAWCAAKLQSVVVAGYSVRTGDGASGFAQCADTRRFYENARHDAFQGNVGFERVTEVLRTGGLVRQANVQDYDLTPVPLSARRVIAELFMPVLTEQPPFTYTPVLLYPYRDTPATDTLLETLPSGVVKATRTKTLQALLDIRGPNATPVLSYSSSDLPIVRALNPADVERMSSWRAYWHNFLSLDGGDDGYVHPPLRVLDVVEQIEVREGDGAVSTRGRWSTVDAFGFQSETMEWVSRASGLGALITAVPGLGEVTRRDGTTLLRPDQVGGWFSSAHDAVEISANVRAPYIPDGDTVLWPLRQGHVRLEKTVDAAVYAAPLASGAQDSRRETVTNNYDSRGALHSATRSSPDVPDVVTTYHHSYTGFLSEIKEESQTDCDASCSRVTSFVPDALSIFPQATQLPTGHTVERSFDYTYGQPTRVEAPDGTVENRTYDALGRLQSVSTDNVDGELKIAWSAVSPVNVTTADAGQTTLRVAAAYQVVETEDYPGSTDDVSRARWYGPDGRLVRESSTGLTGETVWMEHQYDEIGRRVRSTRPHVAPLNASQGTIRADYDALDRVTSEHFPSPKGSGDTTLDYVYASAGDQPAGTAQWFTGDYTRHAAVVVQTSSEQSAATTIQGYGPRGELLTSAQAPRDGSTSAVSKFYPGVDGEPLSITGPDGDSVSITNNSVGAQASLADSESGQHSWTYDGFGRTQVHLDNSTRHEFDYDVGDRILAERVTGGSLAPESTTWEWDISADDLERELEPEITNAGKLVAVKRDDGFEERYTYMGHAGQLDSVTRLVPGVNGGAAVELVMGFRYDTRGRLVRIFYPGALRRAQRNHYNASGHVDETHLQELTATGDVVRESRIWKLNGVYEGQQYADTEVAGGLVEHRDYGTSGALRGLESRWRGAVVQHDTFKRDDLGRIVERQVLGKERPHVFAYDSFGRLTRRTDGLGADAAVLESYSYSLGGRLTKGGTSTSYGETASPFPAAIKALSRGADTLTYGYVPAYGLMSSVNGTWSGQALQVQLAYDAQRRVRSVDGGDQDTSYRYDMQGLRVSRVVRGGEETDLEFSVYYGKLYERSDRDGVVEHTLRLTDGNGTVVAEQRATDTFSTTSGLWSTSFAPTRALVRDYLGSTLAAPAPTEDAVLREFDSFGAPNAELSTTQLVFTGHRGLANALPFVDMGGRVYDLNSSQFLQPDPTFPDLGDPQSFNRRRYARNDPVNVWDPTGFGDDRCPGCTGTAGAGGDVSTSGADVKRLAKSLVKRGVNRRELRRFERRERRQRKDARKRFDKGPFNPPDPSSAPLSESADVTPDPSEGGSAGPTAAPSGGRGRCFPFTCDAAERAVVVADAIDTTAEIVDKAITIFNAARAGIQLGIAAVRFGPTLAKLAFQSGRAALARGSVRLAGKAAARGGMNSSNALSGVERASAELLDAVGQRRTVQIVAEGSEELRYLNAVGAEANVGGEAMNHILLRPNPSKAAVLEEFLHGTQHQLGIIARRGVAGAEWHVKNFMIRHARLLGLGAEDVERLTILRDMGL